MPKLVFTGGSITKGNGWDFRDTYQRDNFWVNRVGAEIPIFSNLEMLNLGISNGNNDEIFRASVDVLAKYGHDISYLFCSWVSVPRYRYSLGLEPWSTQDSQQDLLEDIEINKIIIKKDYVNNLKRRFFTLHHLHFEITKILEYVNIVSRLGQRLGVPVFHINDTCPWDEEYFTIQTGTPSNYTYFTQTEILNVDNRPDDEIYKLYKRMHRDYDLAGGVNPDRWINLYQSWKNLQIDYNPDGTHPGVRSNEIYVDVMKKNVSEKLENQ